jgi:hypothetical protein
VFDDQFVLLVDGHLHMVTDHAAVSPRDLATVGIRHGNVFFSALLPWLLVALVTLLGLLPRLQLLLHLLCRGRPERGFLGILTVEWLKVRLDLRVDLLDQPYERSLAEVPLLPVDGLTRAPVNRDQLSSKQVECFAQQRQLPADLLNGGSMVPAEVGDGLEVWSQLAQQPHQFQIPGRFLLQAPTGPNPIQIESQQVSRIITRPSCFSRHRPHEASRLQIELLDKGIQQAHRILFTDVIVDGFRQHVRLVCGPLREYSPFSRLPWSWLWRSLELSWRCWQGVFTQSGLLLGNPGRINRGKINAAHGFCYCTWVWAARAWANISAKLIFPKCCSRQCW